MSHCFLLGHFYNLLLFYHPFFFNIFYVILLFPFPSGKLGIICLEDLIHEIYSVGKNFRVANNFLLPFKLSVARHAARDKAGLLKDLGNPGFRGTDINSIIRQLNWGEKKKHMRTGRWTVTSRMPYFLRTFPNNKIFNFFFLISLPDILVTVSLAIGLTVHPFPHSTCRMLGNMKLTWGRISFAHADSLLRL